MAAAATTVTQTWFYAGLRIFRGKEIHAWQPNPNDDELRHFAKLKGGVIGGAYAVEVSEDGTTVYGKASYLVDVPPADAEGAGWLADDRGARYQRDALRAEKRAAADAGIEEALELLRRHAASASYAGRYAFAQWVASEITRPERSK